MNRALGTLLVCLRPAVGFGILAVTNPAAAQRACELAHVSASDGTPFDDFGWAVAVSGDTALVSAPQDNDNGADSGSAYIFRLNGSTWVEEQKLLASDGQNSDHFGGHVCHKDRYRGKIFY